ncbi:MAG: hypothetical protein IJ104_00600 [Methanobrevibacter sp.]|nr:hypothetical protein [Methanobrevibacter sp.]MBQ9024868.1 hypothetical protein [Methanobrevibacter sp.]
MPPFFPNAMMELYSYNQSTGEYTEWGEPLPEYTLRDEVEVDFQPISAKSSMEEFGKILQDTYVVYMSIDTEIYDTDLIVIDGVKYSVIGSIEVWNHIIHHKRMTIQKQRKQ